MGFDEKDDTDDEKTMTVITMWSTYDNLCKEFILNLEEFSRDFVFFFFFLI